MPPLRSQIASLADTFAAGALACHDDARVGLGVECFTHRNAGTLVRRNVWRYAFRTAPTRALAPTRGISMARYWTENDKRRSTELAIAIKEAGDAHDPVLEAAAWRDLDELHGVSFVIHRRNAAGVRVGDVVTLRWDGDAVPHLTAAGQGHPAAVEALLYALERLDAPDTRWTWDANAGVWVDG